MKYVVPQRGFMGTENSVGISVFLNARSGNEYFTSLLTLTDHLGDPLTSYNPHSFYAEHGTNSWHIARSRLCFCLEEEQHIIF